MKEIEEPEDIRPLAIITKQKLYNQFTHEELKNKRLIYATLCEFIIDQLGSCDSYDQQLATCHAIYNNLLYLAAEASTNDSTLLH